MMSAGYETLWASSDNVCELLTFPPEGTLLKKASDRDGAIGFRLWGSLGPSKGHRALI